MALGLTLGLAWQGLRSWNTRQVLIAAVASIAMGVLIGIATVLIPNNLFARDIPPVWWNYPVWIVTSVFTGMLIATYVRSTPTTQAPEPKKRSGKFGMAGGILAWFAVGCPVCNKIALLAFGYSGAITWFAPIQPVLAVGALMLTGVALIWRLKGQVACSLPRKPGKSLTVHPEQERVRG